MINTYCKNNGVEEMTQEEMTQDEKLAEYYSRTIFGKSMFFEDLSLKFITKETGKQSEPTRVLESYAPYDDNEQLLHLTQVVVNMGGKIYLINAGGVHELEGESTDRGVSIFRQYHDESGEIYETQEQFHKGSMLKETKLVGKARYLSTKDEMKITPKKKSVPIEALNTHVIWRD